MKVKKEMKIKMNKTMMNIMKMGGLQMKIKINMN